MSFADPQTVTINSVAKTLPRVSTSNLQSQYRTADEAYTLDISHQETKAGRTRRMARVTSRVVAADPLTAQNEYKEASVYIVIDEPEYGFDDTALGYLITGLKDWIVAGTNASKLLGSEH